MDVFHAASMRAGKIYDETWKIQEAFIEKFCRTFMHQAKFSKISKNSTKLYKTCLGIWVESFPALNRLDH